MRKMKLSVEDLRVESFGTEAPEERRGTVYGHSHRGSCYFGCTAELTCYYEDSVFDCETASCLGGACDISDYESDCTWGGRGGEQCGSGEC